MLKKRHPKIKKNNVEDLNTLENDDGVRLFSEGDIKNYIQQFCKQLYPKHSLPTYEKLWSNYIENKAQVYQENIWIPSKNAIEEVKKVLCLLGNNKSEDKHTIKIEFSICDEKQMQVY